MHEPHEAGDAGSLWRAQPHENTIALPVPFLRRRAGVLSAGTRAEILSSLCAGAFFVAILAARLELRRDPLVIALAGLVLCWILITVYRFRNRIWPKDGPAEDAFSAPAVAFYRAELERRRKHLGSVWIWSGPLILACVTLAVILLREGIPSSRRLLTVAPLLLLLAVWTAIGIRRRQQLAAEIQKEIDELAGL